MQSGHHKPPAKFGALLGMAPGGVPIYSSDYDSADEREYPTRQSYQSYIDGVFMGYKWQCVEFARRWLYLNKGYIFEDIPMAYDIFDLRHVRPPREMPDYIARRRPCRDFEKFRPLFEQCQAELDSGERFTMSFSREQGMAVGDFYILRGLLTYIAEKRDPVWSGR